MYKIEFKRSAKKELSKLPQKDQVLILKAIKRLSDDPLPSGSKKIVGSELTYRIRIGNYRVIYNLYNKELTIEVVRIGHRKNIYQKK